MKISQGNFPKEIYAGNFHNKIYVYVDYLLGI